MIHARFGPIGMLQDQGRPGSWWTTGQDKILEHVAFKKPNREWMVLLLYVHLTDCQLSRSKDIAYDFIFVSSKFKTHLHF